MFEMGKQALGSPLEDKMKFEQGESGYSFGFVLMSLSVVLMLITHDLADIKQLAPLLRTRPVRPTPSSFSTYLRTTRLRGLLWRTARILLS